MKKLDMFAKRSKSFLQNKNMNRQIKFRIWEQIWAKTDDEGGASDTEKVWEMTYFGLQDGGPWLDGTNYGHEKGVIMQYTGLKDKNGKEIYEGDIVKRIGVETFTETGEATCIVEDIRFMTHLLYHEGYEVEVIGNVYDNKDLLK